MTKVVEITAVVAPANTIMLVYTKLKGKLACYNVDTTDVEEARDIVKGSMSVRHKAPVLALLIGSPRTKSVKNPEKSVD